MCEKPYKDTKITVCWRAFVRKIVQKYIQKQLIQGFCMKSRFDDPAAPARSIQWEDIIKGKQRYGKTGLTLKA